MYVQFLTKPMRANIANGPIFVPHPICHLYVLNPDKYTIYGEDVSDKEVKSSFGDYDT